MEPVLTVHNRGFRYGDHVFESIKVINGKPCFLNEHFVRLKDAMHALKFDVSEGFSYADLNNQIVELIERNGITDGGKVRITVFRNSDGTYKPENNAKSFLIEAYPMEDNGYVLNEHGLKIGLYTEMKKRKNRFSPFKTGNALLYVMAGVYAQEEGMDDVFIVNGFDRIIEATSSNIFLYKNGSLYTPPVEDGCVNGIIRSQVMKLAEKLGINVFEGMLNMGNILYADELFLTNSISGIRWARQFKDKEFSSDIAVQLIGELNSRAIN